MRTFDWSVYTGNLTWLPTRTLFLTRHGSHAYGTAIATSDLDVRGICIAPRGHYLGFLEVFEQAESKDPDLVVFELRKFFRLATDCNPNALELLFTDEDDHLAITPLGEKLLEHRSEFLSQKIKHTMAGYALSQLKRINLHHRWLGKPPTGAPTRAEFGLPERTVIPEDQLEAAHAAIRKRVDEWSWHELEHLEPSLRQAMQDEFTRRLLEITQWSWQEVDDRVWNAAAASIGLSTNFIELLDLERRYTARLREWQQYQQWVKTRNPARAALEAKFGYDTKHGMHLVRLLRMCREVLTDGILRVRRPDAEELLAIRAGSWPYERLVEWAAAEDAALGELMKTSPLPKQPDRAKLDRLCIELADASFR